MRCDGKVKRDGHEEEFVTKALGHIFETTFNEMPVE